MKLLASFLILTAWCISENMTDMKCYTCPTGDDICEAKKTNFTAKTCENAEKSAETKFKCFKTEKAGKIKRGCAIDKGNKTYCAEEIKKDKDQKCFECEKELCNAARDYVKEKFYAGLIATGSFIILRKLS